MEAEAGAMTSPEGALEPAKPLEVARGQETVLP